MAKLSNGNFYHLSVFVKLYSFSVSATFGPTPAYNDQALDEIVKIMNKEIPLNGKRVVITFNLKKEELKYKIVLRWIDGKTTGKKGQAISRYGKTVQRT